MPGLIDLSTIKERLFKIFNNKYEFDFTNFKNTHSIIDVKCLTHGWNRQILKNLLSGHGCRKCSYLAISDKQKSDFNDVISKFKSVHGNKYDYSKFKYSNNRTNSIIECPYHGGFYQSPWTHFKGHGCPSCSKNKKLHTDDFIKKSKEIHRDYVYDFTCYKNMYSPVEIICKKHGSFSQIAQTHINGSGCPKCNQSKGEKMVEDFLIKNKIIYNSQKKFSDLKHKKHLIFDFYLPEYNTCIEFNGIQHYFPIDIFGGEEALDLNQKRDEIKRNYCEENGINFIVIKQDLKHINISDVEHQINSILSEL